MPTKNNELSKSEERRIASLKEGEEKAAAGGEKVAEEVKETPAVLPVVESPDDGEEMVQVRKADLEEFLHRLDNLEGDNRRLLEAADKGRMFQISEKERAGQKLLPTVKITRMGGPTGKMVLAWNMTRNESYVDGNRMVEHQEIEIFYVDGTSEKMPLINFYRQQNKETIGKILSRTRDEDGGGEMLKLELANGDILEIELKFVN